MKISEMIEQLEALKKQAGDVEVATYYGGSYECCQPVRYIELVEANNRLSDFQSPSWGFFFCVSCCNI